MLLNLASVANAADADGALGLHRPLRAGHHARAVSPRLAALVGHAIAYYRDFVAPDPQLPRPERRRSGRRLEELHGWLGAAGEHADAEAIQYELYEIGKRHAFANLRDWFKALYEVLLGQSEGPRFGTFVAIYGTAETRTLIESALRREAEAA